MGAVLPTQLLLSATRYDRWSGKYRAAGVGGEEPQTTVDFEVAYKKITDAGFVLMPKQNDYEFKESITTSFSEKVTMLLYRSFNCKQLEVALKTCRTRHHKWW